jgi:PPOX class probable FMN-dependent enzyme
MNKIENVGDLRQMYGTPSERALKKEMTTLDRHCRHFISMSPFLTMATSGADGRLDCSPRGDAPGFVHVVDDATLLIPDRRGNNRVDSLTNVVEHGRVGLLFLVPGVNETLRVNGKARIIEETSTLEPLAAKGKTPKTGLLVDIEEVYFQCAKALVRSHLWDSDAQIERSSFPTLGQVLADQIGEMDATTFDAEAGDPERSRLY